MKKSIGFTLPGGYVKGFHLWTETTAPNWLKCEYSLVDEASTQNRLRRKLGILARMGLGINIWHDIAITWDDNKKVFQIWACTRNWSTRASYYAGMIYAYNRMRPVQTKKQQIVVR